MFNRIKPTEVEMLVKPEAAFNSALTRFKTADTAVTKLTHQFNEAKAHRLEAALASAAAESDVEKFTKGGDFNIGKASDVAERKQKADLAVSFIDRGIDHLETQLANAKIDVITAERDCITAQAEYHDSMLDESTHKWLRSNAKELQRLCQQLHLVQIFQRVRSDGPQPQYSATDIENLFLFALPRLVSNEFSDDETFRQGCQAALTGTPINRVTTSTNVSASERSTIKSIGNRERQIAALRELSVPIVEPAFDRSRAMTTINYENQRIRHMTNAIAGIETRFKRANERIALPSTKADREKDELEIKRIQANIATAQQKIDALQEQLQADAA